MRKESTLLVHRFKVAVLRKGTNSVIVMTDFVRILPVARGARTSVTRQGSLDSPDSYGECNVKRHVRHVIPERGPQRHLP